MHLGRLLSLGSPLGATGVQVLPSAHPATATTRGADWSALNTTLHGRLRSGRPFALPCFDQLDGDPSSINETACASRQDNFGVADYRQHFYGQTMQPQWEGCQATGAACHLNPSNATTLRDSAASGTCDMGSISPYFIEVRTAAEVQAAFSFAEAHNVSLSIKSSGHDYKGHSSSAGSLALWVKGLSNLTYSPTFVPEGCSSEASYSAITAGSGAATEDAYIFADAMNVTLVGGYTGSVSLSGGWVQGGGHSLLSTAYGLGVDRVLQYRLVTPDGEYRVANACQNKALFWALRGGGGGTFGLVLDATHKVEPVMPLQVASFAFDRTSSQQMLEFYSIIVNNTALWEAQGWGGHVAASLFIYINPGLSLEAARVAMLPLANWILAQNGTASVESTSTYLSFYEKYLIPISDPSGSSYILASGLIPKSTFSTPAGRTRIQTLLKRFLVEANIEAHMQVVGPPSALDTGATSVTPAWYASVWELLVTVSLPFGSTPTELQALYAKAHDLAGWIAEAFPDSGVYLNESDVYQTDYENAFWGENYPRLLALKTLYDPKHLLDVWQGVGWEGPQSPRYSCYVDISRK